jgi:hypothetical protein
MCPPLAFYIQCRILVGLRNAATPLRKEREFSGHAALKGKAVHTVAGVRVK